MYGANAVRNLFVRTKIANIKRILQPPTNKNNIITTAVTALRKTSEAQISTSCHYQCAGSDSGRASGSSFNMEKEDLKNRLTSIQYHVTQEAGTERPFTGCYNKVYEDGMYVCIVCRQDLFSSKTKYDSGCGWPAFNDVLAKEKVTLHKDTSSGLVRTEVRCSSCSAHLGHVFDDGPAPTKKRFCINSASLEFVPGKGSAEEKS